ncbi:MAG TPA: hypothetical protein VJT31_34185 [Rugosimonospora sp.]|nr:hypothetical protein [Rugosimonospora sp.]
MVRAADDKAGIRADIDVSSEAPGPEDDSVDLDMLDLDDADLIDGDDLDGEPGDDAEAVARARRRTIRWLVMAGLAGILVVLVAMLGPTWWSLITQRHEKLAIPDSLAGLNLDRSADGQATADYLRTAVAASVNLDTSVGAVYDDPGNKQKSVMIFGGTGLIVSPDQELTKAFQLLDDQGGGMSGVHAVPSGARGGEMKCGTSTGDGGDMVVCGWADHGSIALALFPGRSEADASRLMQRIRDGVQHGG